MLAANPIFPRPTFSASSAQLPSTSGLCIFSCSSVPPRSVGCQLSAVSSPATPFPATLRPKSQLIENPAALSPVLATLTSRVHHNPFVCRSYEKHRGSHLSRQRSFRSCFTRPNFLPIHHSPLAIKSFGIRSSKTQHLKPALF